MRHSFSPTSGDVSADFSLVVGVQQVSNHSKHMLVCKKAPPRIDPPPQSANPSPSHPPVPRELDYRNRVETLTEALDQYLRERPGDYIQWLVGQTWIEELVPHAQHRDRSASSPLPSRRAGI